MVRLPPSLLPFWVLPLCPPDCFLGPAFPVVVPRCLACLLLSTRSTMMSFTFLVCVSFPPFSLLPLLLMLPRLPTVMMKFLFHVSRFILLWFHVMVMLQFLPFTPAFLAFAPQLSPLLFAHNLLFALNRPRRLEAVADALSGMVNTEVLLLLFLLLLPSPSPKNALTSCISPMQPCR
jgi:hypothetical protein